MVKIKEGYVMNAREKVEFDRVNALPRKTSGVVAYYFKPQTKYPPRIYVFMHAEIWCDRNRRPMGLFHTMPFLSRPMNREEIEYHHFDIRLCYHHYEDWDKLIYAEEQEAEELDKENPDTGSAFLEKLKSYRNDYPVGYAKNLPPRIKEQLTESGESNLMGELMTNGQHYSLQQISELLNKEQQGEKRMTILILLRELYKSRATGQTEGFNITIAEIERKALMSQQRTRRNYVRRVYQKNKLFALEEVRAKYPDYTEAMLQADLLVKKRRFRKKKSKPIVDLRRCQLEKLARKLNFENLSEHDYHHTCCRIVLLQNALKLRLPIRLTVTLNKNKLIYSFNWRTRESVVKSFVGLANAKGMTHEQLALRHKEMSSSNYSF
ncbi:hypothetical protein [Mucilaginibacter sp. 44-25]|uniref:hypothetical protein n=1 Tax=Mucilaginibacter sp. 44-25 TaxID=1895794 RepID=UPI00095B9129|nr:hypothetical protein [Mucilaginibacter sp. 44-25]OJW13926.1 MAG: hypothetical protein BGO48_04205 [Mucilaginibacter sp. 44-25]